MKDIIRFPPPSELEVRIDATKRSEEVVVHVSSPSMKLADHKSDGAKRKRAVALLEVVSDNPDVTAGPDKDKLASDYSDATRIQMEDRKVVTETSSDVTKCRRSTSSSSKYQGVREANKRALSSAERKWRPG